MLASRCYCLHDQSVAWPTHSPVLMVWVILIGFVKFILLICFSLFMFFYFCPSSNSLDEQADELDVTKIRRKTLFYLISTLNASFCNDADFSDCKGEDFSKEVSIKVSVQLARQLDWHGDVGLGVILEERGVLRRDAHLHHTLSLACNLICPDIP